MEFSALIKNMVGLVADLKQPEFLYFGGVAFAVLALYWHNTGRFFLVGWLVKILWLPINAVMAVLWFFAVVFNLFFDFIRNNLIFKRIIFLCLIGLIYFIYSVHPEHLILYLILSLLAFYLVMFGLNEEAIRHKIFYLPTAKRTPTRKIRQPKAAKPKKAPLSGTRQVMDSPPIVQLATDKPRGKFETEQEIIGKLDPHLQQLLGIGDHE
jgi:hypothetical protein